jgi:hypothetical protein
VVYLVDTDPLHVRSGYEAAGALRVSEIGWMTSKNRVRRVV